LGASDKRRDAHSQRRRMREENYTGACGARTSTCIRIICHWGNARGAQGNTGLDSTGPDPSNVLKGPRKGINKRGAKGLESEGGKKVSKSGCEEIIENETREFPEPPHPGEGHPEGKP